MLLPQMKHSLSFPSDLPIYAPPPPPTPNPTPLPQPLSHTHTPNPSVFAMSFYPHTRNKCFYNKKKKKEKIWHPTTKNTIEQFISKPVTNIQFTQQDKASQVKAVLALSGRMSLGWWIPDDWCCQSSPGVACPRAVRSDKLK